MVERQAYLFLLNFSLHSIKVLFKGMLWYRLGVLDSDLKLIGKKFE